MWPTSQSSSSNERTCTDDSLTTYTNTYSVAILQSSQSQSSKQLHCSCRSSTRKVPSMLDNSSSPSRCANIQMPMWHHFASPQSPASAKSGPISTEFPAEQLPTAAEFPDDAASAKRNDSAAKQYNKFAVSIAINQLQHGESESIQPQEQSGESKSKSDRECGIEARGAERIWRHQHGKCGR